MNIEIFAWCSTRELFVTGMTTTALPDGSMLATLSEDGNLIPHEGVIIDEIGPITKVPAVYDEDGDIRDPRSHHRWASRKPHGNGRYRLDAHHGTA